MSRDEAGANPAEIPEEVQQRDQWLYWNASNDTPRAPLDSPTSRYGCSWSEPETWLPFREAVEGAEAVETAGIGYVNAADNSDYDEGRYGIVDLDGVVDEDGHPKDWVPSLQPFFDRNAYAEYSPSNKGLHIPVKDIEVPDWWADQHFSDDEHRGVEVLTNKFSTYTGNKLRGAGDSVVEYGGWFDEWLAEAHKAVTGDDPRGDENQTLDSGDGDTPGTREEWLTEDVAEAALDEIPPDVAYPTWRDIGMALANHFGRSTGGRLFKAWSRRGSKWDSDAKDQAERIIEDASSYNYDAGTIVYYAKPQGFDASEHASAAVSGDVSGPASRQNKPGDTGQEPSEGEWMDLPLSPEGTLQRAAISPYSPADEDTTLRGLRASEIAEFSWDLAQANGRGDVLAVEDGPLYRFAGKVWVPDPDETHARRIGREACGPMYSSTIRKEIVERIRDDRTRSREEMGASTGTFGTEAGLVDLQPAVDSSDTDNVHTREIEPGDRLLHCLPVEYDPNAGCPQFREFIGESVAGEDIEKLQEYAGYVLWHGTQPFGKALFLVGPTDSGKGTFLSILKELLGGSDAPIANESLQDLTGRWGAAELYGNWANVRNEVTPNDVGNVQKFKEFTGGGDRVSAEFKGQDKFQFDVTQKFIFAMNQLPELDNADRAFWNRLLFAEFTDTVPEDEQDPNMADRLVRTEAPGILNWMIEGLVRLLDREQFTGARSIDKKRSLVGQYGDTFDRFWDRLITHTGDDGDYIVKRDLYDLANTYADEIDMEPSWNKLAGFTRLIKERGADTMRTTHGFDERTGVYIGVKIANKSALRDLAVDVDHGQMYDGAAQDRF